MSTFKTQTQNLSLWDAEAKRITVRFTEGLYTTEDERELELLRNCKACFELTPAAPRKAAPRIEEEVAEEQKQEPALKPTTLKRMNVADMRAFAHDNGIVYEKGATKLEIRAAIADALDLAV